MMRDSEGDSVEWDVRVGGALSEVVGNGVLDDVHFERLARRIGVSGAERLRRMRVARRTVRLQWAGSVVSAGLAASAVLALVLMHTSPGESPAVAGGVASSVVSSDSGGAGTDQVRDDRRELFAASVGEISEEEFLANVGGHVDAAALLGGNRE